MQQSTVSSQATLTSSQVELPTTMGLDLSDRLSHYHVLKGDGQTLVRGKLPTLREDLAQLFNRWKGCRLVIEAGGHSPWISRLGAECGMEVVVANPRRVELISKSDRKTDRTDAELLAELGRTNVALLAPITHRSKETQADLAIQRARDEAVGVRTSLINHVRGVLKSNGHRAPGVSPESFGIRVEASIPADLAAALKPLLRLIQQVNVQVKQFDREIAKVSRERYPITQLLQQLPGVGPLVSFAYVTTLEDPKRFKSARDVGAYLGLVPRKRSSGKSDPQMRITKAGDGQTRRLLVLAANYIMGRFGPDCDLRRYGLKIAGNGTDKAAKKRGRVAVARKLAVLMHHLWRTGEVYDPFHTTKKRGEPMPG